MKRLPLPTTLLFSHGSARLVFQTIVAVLAIVCISIAAFSDLVRQPDRGLLKSDFAAFYCGAVVAARHADPYAATPLAACEYDRVYRPGGVPRSAAPVDPDPLPGYDMAFFRPLTALPFREAAFIFDAVLIAAIAATALLVAQLTGLPVLVVASTLAYLDGFTSIPFGQTSPLAVFGIALAAYGVVRNRRFAVVLGAACTMFVPQVGLAVCCALLVWRPNLRIGVIGLGIGFGAISILTLGVQLNLEYLKVALPAQAIAESGTSIQYGAAWLLQFCGVASPISLKIAALQYAAFLIAGVAFAGLVERRLRTGAALVMFPAVAVLIGGTYIHIQHMAIALPFALLLAARTRQPAAWIAVGLLAVPWPADRHLLLLAAAAVIATIVLTALPAALPRRTLGLACIVIAAYGFTAGPLMTRLLPANAHYRLAAVPPMPRALDGDRLASAEHAREVRMNPLESTSTLQTLAAKLPTWIALVTLIAVGCGGPSSAPGPSGQSIWDVNEFRPQRRARTLA